MKKMKKKYRVGTVSVGHSLYKLLVEDGTSWYVDHCVYRTAKAGHVRHVLARFALLEVLLLLRTRPWSD